MADEGKRHDTAMLFRSLGNANRLAILLALLDGGRAVAELEAELGIRQPILSQQLAILREAGLVTARKEPRSTYYVLSGPHAAPVERILRAALGDPEEARAAAKSRPEKRLAKRQDEAAPGPRAPTRIDAAAVFARVEA